MLRRKAVRTAVLSLVVLGATLWSLAPSSPAAEKHRYQLGRVIVDEDGTLSLAAYNPTGKDINVEFEIKDPSGWGSSGPNVLLVQAHNGNSITFSCPTGPCAGFPQITAPTPKVVLNAVFPANASFTIRTHGFAGDWKKIS